jgi:hypothetical protein
MGAFPASPGTGLSAPIPQPARGGLAVFPLLSLARVAVFKMYLVLLKICQAVAKMNLYL